MQLIQALLRCKAPLNIVRNFTEVESLSDPPFHCCAKTPESVHYLEHCLKKRGKYATHFLRSGHRISRLNATILFLTSLFLYEGKKYTAVACLSFLAIASIDYRIENMRTCLLRKQCYANCCTTMPRWQKLLGTMLQDMSDIRSLKSRIFDDQQGCIIGQKRCNLRVNWTLQETELGEKDETKQTKLTAK